MIGGKGGGSLGVGILPVLGVDTKPSLDECCE